MRNSLYSFWIYCYGLMLFYFFPIFLVHFVFVIKSPYMFRNGCVLHVFTLGKQYSLCVVALFSRSLRLFYVYFSSLSGVFTTDLYYIILLANNFRLTEIHAFLCSKGMLIRRLCFLLFVGYIFVVLFIICVEFLVQL